MHPGCAQGQGEGQGHVIRALSWILGMSYSVIDGLVLFSITRGHRRMFCCFLRGRGGVQNPIFTKITRDWLFPTALLIFRCKFH